MSFINRAFLGFTLVLTLVHSSGSQAQALTAAFVGNISGFVENENGDLVAPDAAVQATLSAQQTDGVITATLNGTASCSGGLGVHIIFSAEYDAFTGNINGSYTDVPNGTTLDKEIQFELTDNLSWIAYVSGTAVSSSGLRSYDLAIEVNLSEGAIFDGSEYPADRSFSGILADSRLVSFPVVNDSIGLNETLLLPMTLEGTWSAKAVPQAGTNIAITGRASGNFFTTEATPITVTVPLLGTETLDIEFTGSFGGTLQTTDAGEFSFIGSWIAASEAGNLGGDISITIPTNDLSSFPYTITGSIPIDTGIPLIGVITVPFSVSGEIPIEF